MHHAERYKQLCVRNANERYVRNHELFWLAESKCHTSAKRVTPVQITHHNSGLWLAERQKEIFEANDIT